MSDWLRICKTKEKGLVSLGACLSRSFKVVGIILRLIPKRNVTRILRNGWLLKERQKYLNKS